MSDFLDDLIVLGGSRLPGDAKRAEGQFPSSFDNFDHSCRRVSSICKTGNLQLLQIGPSSSWIRMVNSNCIISDCYFNRKPIE